MIGNIACGSISEPAPHKDVGSAHDAPGGRKYGLKKAGKDFFSMHFRPPGASWALSTPLWVAGPEMLQDELIT